MEKSNQEISISHKFRCSECKTVYRAIEDKKGGINIYKEPDQNSNLELVVRDVPFEADMFKVKFKVEFECIKCSHEIKKTIETKNLL